MLLTITEEHLSVVDEDGRRWLRPARFGVRVGGVLQPATHMFELVADGDGDGPKLLEDLSGIF